MNQHSLLTPTVIAGVLASAALSLWVGFRQSGQTKTLADLIPMWRPGRARVRNATEFSATTVASSISLATVVLAYFELASFLGVWLLWTVVTTALGLLAVRLVARRIWSKLQAYGNRIPTLHEFLGSEFGSRRLALIGAFATSLGYLGAFAVELTVGSRLFSGLVVAAPVSVVVIVLALIGLAYTSAGGFRAVVVTDRIQMVSIWVFLVTLSLYYAVFVAEHGGVAAAAQHLPADALRLTSRDGLLAFLIGIFVINVPTYIADMGTWQRVTSIQNPSESLPGLVKSAAAASISWGALALLAILAPMITTPSASTNPLIPLLKSLADPASTLSIFVLFVCVAGLYAAMMSTASTQLIAVSHTVYEDIVSYRVSTVPQERAESSSSLRRARIILVLSATLAVIVVEGLSRAGFTIADLVFSIYGSQLGLFPAVAAALYGNRSRLKRLDTSAAVSVACGFFAGWGSALFGKATGNGNLVFLAPVVSLGISSGLLGLGWLVVRFREDAQLNRA